MRDLTCNSIIPQVLKKFIKHSTIKTFYCTTDRLKFVNFTYGTMKNTGLYKEQLHFFFMSNLTKLYMPKVQAALHFHSVRKGSSSTKIMSQEEKGHCNKTSSRAFLAFHLSPQKISIMLSQLLQ